MIAPNAAEALYRAGLVPERCTSAVFNFNANDASTVTYTVFLTEDQVQAFTKTIQEYLEGLKQCQ